MPLPHTTFNEAFDAYRERYRVVLEGRYWRVQLLSGRLHGDHCVNRRTAENIADELAEKAARAARRRACGHAGVRDGQRERLYHAERTVFEESQAERPLQEILAYGRELWPVAQRVAAQLGLAPVAAPRWVAGRGRNGGAYYQPGGHVITLHRSAQTPTHAAATAGEALQARWVAVHELAHALTARDLVPRKQAAHGPLYAETYAVLVGEVFGPEQETALRAAFRRHRVTTHGPSPETRP